MLRNSLDIIFADAQRVIEKVDFSFLEGKTVLVTGATGLLGTHFLACLALLKEQGMKIEVYGHHLSTPADHTIEIAKRGQIHLRKKGLRFKPDVVIHLSGYAQPQKFTNNQAETIRINTALTHNLLANLKAGGKFLFVSSSEVYSGLESIAMEDSVGTTTVLHPRACYIQGKLCGETIVNAYRQDDVDAKSVRLGLTYGPGCREGDERAMSQFIEMALKYKQINMKHSGMEPRTFCYVQDAIETMWNALLHGNHSVYNVGSPFTYTIGQIANQIAQITNSQIDVLDNAEMIGASGNVIMDVTRAKREFNKYQYVGLAEGLKNTIDWQRGFYEAV